MKDITDWRVINKFSNDFVKQFKYAFVFKSGKSAIIITNDDCVYVCGDNTVGCLGLDDNTREVEVPSKLEKLCHKQVIAIIDCESLMCAQTIDGKLYFWGYSSDDILGNEELDYIKPTLMQSMADKHVTDLIYSEEYWLALTMNGEVYEWKLGGYTHIFEPRLVIALKQHTIIAISCGYDHSLALNDNGEVFSWRGNIFGQCGCGEKFVQSNATKVEDIDDIAIRICCGEAHSLVLTECGDIYAFGSNDCGQLTDEFNGSISGAMKITTSIKFVDIATDGCLSHMSIGLSNDGFCYVWGEVGKRKIRKPTKTKYESIEEVINKNKYQDMTYNSLYFKKKFDYMSSYDRLVQSFDNKESSDVCFKIDGKYIYAQKSYLKIVCNHFSSMFTPNVWLINIAKEIEIIQYSYSVYYAFIKYLYTDSVDIKSKHLIELYCLADSYFEGNLKKKCIELMKSKTNVNNVYTFYSFAIQENLVELEKYFYDYMKAYNVFKTEA